ncbi:hypothetical protein K450DRAFT_253593 [Umbelopsis ramanniana AG]|uniref:CHY-type domain-containing protein n=1 Tax=Umbelopsis ramanniana AG TaxID=1314678 RepID=A0AAD5E5F1_UMBRA|nr:uncharacterized protein K450DRAFT_253593 [Umbelopsis ramanniana AG]KAI8577089.1 hypothetical protein K450DRAFT_253593 [Umbelopsis ramanniana AG]
MLNQPQARRFPPPCRFFSKGTCRAGEQCSFAHILQAVSKQTTLPDTLIADLQAHALSNRDQRPIASGSRRRSTDLHSTEVQKGIQRSQIAQLERHYASTFAVIMNSSTSTIVQVGIKPPHDFTYDLTSLVIQISVPTNYPRSPTTIKVQNCDIPKGFAINLERGYNEHMSSHSPETQPTLIQQTTWLEKHMETLLSRPPATTMRFVKFKSNSANAPEANSTEELQVENSAPSSIKPQPQPRSRYSANQLEKAKLARDRHLKQLETRFPDSYRMLRSDNHGTIIYLRIELSDPSFGLKSIFGDTMDMCITVPPVYPLEPCQIEIMNDNLEDWRLLNIAYGFQQHVVEAPSSLFQHLNWLVRNLDDLMKQSKPRDATVNEGLDQQTVSAPPIPSPKSNITDDLDAIKSKKVYVTDPKELIPPSQISSFEKNDNSSQVNLLGSPSSGSDSEPTSFSAGSKHSRARGGMEIRHPDVSLENIALLQVASISLSLKCNRCRSKFAITDLPVEILDKADESSSVEVSIGERWLACSTCTQIYGVKVFPDYIHENSITLGLVQTAKCTPIQVLPSKYLAVCARCDSNCKNPITVASFGQKVTVACRACHTPLSLMIDKCTMVRIGGLASDWLQADEQEILKVQRKNLQEKSHSKISLGQPLPNTGTCRHFRKSHRWMRFECCMRVYACDKCHDEAESHIYEIAQKMICGYCSREQPYHQQRCIGCERLLTGSYHHASTAKKSEGYKNRAHDLVTTKAGPQLASKKEHRAELQ